MHARLTQVAARRGLPRAQVALAWVLQKEPVVAPIVGTTRVQHLDDANAALSLKLAPDEIADLESACAPHGMVGFCRGGRPDRCLREVSWHEPTAGSLRPVRFTGRGFAVHRLPWHDLAP